MPKAFLKISSLILCGLLIYNSLGYFIALSVMRVAVRHQKWAQIASIPDHRLTTFVFSKNKPNTGLKIINTREIQVDGKLYDIARKTDDGKIITYYCLYDSKEEKLIAKTRQFNSMSQPFPVENTTRLILDKIIKTAVTDQKNEDLTQEFKPVLTYYISIPYSGPDISIPVPPPQVTC
jgi:hypothetical protein